MSGAFTAACVQMRADVEVKTSIDQATSSARRWRAAMYPIDQRAPAAMSTARSGAER